MSRRPNFSGINRMKHHAGIHVWLDTVSVCIADVLGQPVRDLQSVGQAAREHFDWPEGVQWRATTWTGASAARRGEAGRRPAFVRSRRMDTVRRAPQPESLDVSMLEVT